MELLSTEECREIYSIAGNYFILSCLEEVQVNKDNYTIIEREYANIEIALQNLVSESSEMSNTFDQVQRLLYLQEFVLVLADYWIDRCGVHWQNLIYFAELTRDELNGLAQSQLKSKVHHRIGRLYYRIGKYDNAYGVIEEGIAISDIEEDFVAKAHLLYLKSAIERKYQNYHAAKELSWESIKLLDILDDEWGKAIAYYNLGAAEQEDKQNGHYIKAKDYFMVCAQIFEQQCKFDRLARTYIRLAQISSGLREMTIAEEYIHKTERLINRTDYPRIYVNLKLTNAEIKFDQGAFEKANEIVFEVLKISKDNGMSAEKKRLEALAEKIISFRQKGSYT